MGHKVLLLDRAGRIKPCGGAIPPRLIKDFEIPDELLVAKARSARMISPKNNQVDIPIDGGFVGMVDRDKFEEWLRVRAANDGATRRTGIFEKITRDTDGTAILHYRIHSSNRLEEDLKWAVRAKAKRAIPNQVNFIWLLELIISPSNRKRTNHHATHKKWYAKATQEQCTLLKLKLVIKDSSPAS